MNQKGNQSIQGRLAGILPYKKTVSRFLILSIASILLIGNAHGELVDRIIAVVNDDIILLSDLNQMMGMVENNLEQQGYSTFQKRQILNAKRKQLLEQLIYDKLTDQQIQKYGIKINDEDVDATINQIRKANKLSEQDLKRALKQDGLSYDVYRKQIKEKMLRTRLVNREVNSKIVVTDEDIKNYYDAHIDEYGGSKKYELRHILVKIPSTGSETDKSKAFQRIQEIHKKIQKGASFEKMAEQFSEAPSASHGGQLGVFEVSLLSEKVQKALQGIGVKQVSDIVDTDQGYQLFYIEAILQSGGQSLNDVRAEIQEKLYTSIVDQKFNEWIKELRRNSHVQIMK